MYHAFLRTKVLSCSLKTYIFSCAHHSATARFITVSFKGTPVTHEIEIRLGDSGDSYIMFNPEISRVLKTGTVLHGGCAPAQDQDLYPLKFYHETRHLCCASSPYPRLEIPQDLPQQSKANNSPATLHAYGVTHAITLDGTPDAQFQHSVRESIQRLQPVLDKLKEM